MSDHWILGDDHQIVAVDLLTWAKWLEENNDRKIVKQEDVGDYWVSTVFLGLDHGYGSGRPILFETMVFSREATEESPLFPGRKYRRSYWEDRYATWDEAMAGHAHITAYITACGRPPGDEDAASR